jgi:hypothetical protein
VGIMSMLRLRGVCEMVGFVKALWKYLLFKNFEVG